VSAAALPRLSAANVAQLAATVRRPGYDRGALGAGIVHLGLGAFHRAHQAAYNEAVLAAGDLRWGTIGVSLRNPAMRDALAPQDNLYTLALRDGAGESLQVIGGLTACVVAPENPERPRSSRSCPKRPKRCSTRASSTTASSTNT